MRSRLARFAKAFFYAEPGALFVSHWPVDSQFSTALTQGVVEELKDHSEIDLAEALRRSMFTLAANDDYPYRAHPAFWAPFVVVGEGARR